MAIIATRRATLHKQSSLLSSNLNQYGNIGNHKINMSQKSSVVKDINPYAIIMWSTFFVVTLLVYFFISSADFGVLLTFSSLFRAFGFAILNLKIWTTKSVAGISIKTLQLYCLVFLGTCLSIWEHESYLPWDDTGYWFIHIVEAASFVLALSALFASSVPFKKTYQHDIDTFGEQNVPPGFGALYLAIPSFIIALMFHANFNEHFSDVAFAFAMYLESVAMLPQLYMFQKQGNKVELLTAHFTCAMGFGRVIGFYFWWKIHFSFESDSGSNIVGNLIIFSQIIQIFLMLDFFWFYIKAMKNATPLVSGFDLV